MPCPYTVYHWSLTELYWVINGGGIRAEGATNSGRKALRPYDWWLSRNGWEIRVGAQLIW